MQNEISQAKEILINSGLFTSVVEKTAGEWPYLKPFFRARECGMVSSVQEAQKIIDDLNEKLAPFVVGAGCAVLGYSDVMACHVIWASEDGKRVRVQEDTATILNGVNSGHPEALHFAPGGFCGHTSGKQIWDLKPNPNGAIHEFSLRLNGEWRKKGDSMNSPCLRLSKTHYHHYDYNF